MRQRSGRGVHRMVPQSLTVALKLAAQCLASSRFMCVAVQRFSLFCQDCRKRLPLFVTYIFCASNRHVVLHPGGSVILAVIQCTTCSDGICVCVYLFACVQGRRPETGMIDIGANRPRDCESFPHGIEEYTFGSCVFGKWSQYLQCMHALRQNGSDDRLPVRP